MDTKDTIACGECGVENPKSRGTCIVCHKPLRRKTDAGRDAQEKKTEKPGSKTTPKNPFDDSKKESTKSAIASASISPASKKVIKRRARRKSRKSTNEQYFILGVAGLIPVEIGIKVKKAEAKGDASKLIDFYKRNKTLISG